MLGRDNVIGIISAFSVCGFPAVYYPLTRIIEPLALIHELYLHNRFHISVTSSVHLRREFRVAFNTAAVTATHRPDSHPISETQRQTKLHKNSSLFHCYNIIAGAKIRPNRTGLDGETRPLCIILLNVSLGCFIFTSIE